MIQGVEQVAKTVLLAAAATRFAFALIFEDGPYDIFSYWRELWGIVLQPAEEGEGFEGVEAVSTTGWRVFSCPYCFTGWLTLAMGLLCRWWPSLGWGIVKWGAAWEIAYWLLKMRQKLLR